MRNERKTARRGGASEAGFTLLEVLVAVAIFTIVTGAIYSLLKVGQSDAFHTTQKTETTQNARVALNAIGRDAINSGVGYWNFGANLPDGTFQRLMFLSGETDGAPDVLTPVVPGDDVRTIGVNGASVAVDAITFAYEDNAFNGGQSIAASNINETNGIVTVDNNGPCASGETYVYIIDNGNSPALGSLTKLDGTTRLYFEEAKDPLLINKKGTGSPFDLLGTEQAAIRRVKWVTYYVRDDRTLVRREYGSTSDLVGDGLEGGGLGGVVPTDAQDKELGYVEMPLAFNVSDFQIRYVLADGSTVDNVTATLDENGQTITAAERRASIRLVTVEIKLDGPETDPVTGQAVQVTLRGSFYTPNLAVDEQVDEPA
jgi:prepilin-type N-terminal cleavage/methylation domain-containing protein